jgi:hypothetical protein
VVVNVFFIFSYTCTAYVQQIGRAGRSGFQAEGILYFNNSDLGQPSVQKSMKDFCRNGSNCRRKELNGYFGCEVNSSIDNCCDICQPDIKEPWLLCAVATPDQKIAIRDKMEKHLKETDFLLDPFIVERIVYDAHLYQNSQSLESEFGLSAELAATIANILESCLH